MEQTEAPQEQGEDVATEESSEGRNDETAENTEVAAETEGAVEAVLEPAPEESAQVPQAPPAYSVPEPQSKLSRPPVIDVAALLQPVSGENPSGEYLRYSGVYDEINEARRADDNLARGEWQQELKVAEYRKVIDIAVPVLEKESKDLQIAALLSEALIMEHGFEGLRDSLRLLTGLQKTFWDTLYPELYDGDMEGRANAVSLVDSEGGLALMKAPITPSGFSFLDFLDSKKYDLPDNIDSLATEDADRLRNAEAEAVRLGKVTADRWEAEISQSRRAFYEELNVAIEECSKALGDLNLAIEEKFDVNQSPSTRTLRKALDDIKSQTDKILERKREEEPDEIPDEEGAEDGSGAGRSGAGAGASGAIQGRADALKRLSELAAFFRRTEPHSPVSYLVTRAVKWGNMPLESWLQDVIKDETILYQLRQTLGFNTGESDTGGEAQSGADETY